MLVSYYLSVWLHIICAAFWIGGMLVLPLVMIPAIKNNPEKRQVMMVTGLKFRFYGYIVFALLLITGITNMYFRGIHFSWEFFTTARYGRLVVLKVILFVVMMLAALIHDLFLGKKAADKMDEHDRIQIRKVARWTGRILLLVSFAMVYIGVVIARGG